MTRLLALVLAAWLMAGCDIIGSTKSAPPPKPLSHAQFVRAANRACARAIRRIPKFHSRSFEALDKKLGVLIRVQEHLIFVLRGLAPPPADVATFRHMLATFDATDLLGNHFVDAVDAHQFSRAKALVRRIVAFGRHGDSFARKLGLPVCAKAG